MFEGFADKSAKILVVEGQQAIRNMIVEVLREQGFRPQSTGSLDDALAMLSASHYDWLIAGNDTGDKVQSRDLLLLAIKHPELRNLSVSLMVEEAVLDSMPDFFALGLLSYHVRPFTKASFSAEIINLLETMFTWNYRAPLVAGANLRSFLISRNRADDVVEFDLALTALYPLDTLLLKNLVGSLKMAGRYKEALAALKRAELLSEDFSEHAPEMIRETITKAAAAANYDLGSPLTSQDTLGFSSIVVIDNDDSIVAAAKEILTEGGATDLNTFSDGESYWTWQQANPVPSLIIMEWKLPKVTGSKLLQRITGIKGQNPPAIIIQSSQLTGQDLGLLKELGVTSILQKPWRKTNLVASIVTGAVCTARPTTNKQLETRIRALLRARKTAEAAGLIQSLTLDPMAKPGNTMLLQAELAIAYKNFSNARDLCTAAMKLDHEPVIALHTLGKALLGLGQFEVSVKCFERAEKLSPINVERLCLLATAESEAGNGTAATERVKAALQIDSGNEMVQETDAQVSIANGDTERAANILETLPSLMNVVAYQNNRAVALAKSTRVDEALETYRKTIEVLPEKANDTRATVQYNLALSYVKSVKLDLADEALKAILAAPASRVHPKAKSLLAKLKQALEQKIPMVLNQIESAPPMPEIVAPGAKDALIDATGVVVPTGPTGTSSEATTPSLFNLIDLQPGSRACFQIFKPTDTASDKLQAMFQSLPRFSLKPNRDQAA